jgi:hypothetical protein
MGVYPRVDSYYKNKSSLDFDLMKTQLMIKKKGGGAELYLAHAVCGVLMGLLAFLLSFFEEEV